MSCKLRLQLYRQLPNQLESESLCGAFCISLMHQHRRRYGRLAGPCPEKILAPMQAWLWPSAVASLAKNDGISSADMKPNFGFSDSTPTVVLHETHVYI